jgi:hypothetical protein
LYDLLWIEEMMRWVTRDFMVVTVQVQVASWGGELLERKILTMSLAPRDNHEAQVQFALERGIPAILGIIATQRMPYPASAFDMAHCSRCLIPWTEFGKLKFATSYTENPTANRSCVVYTFGLKKRNWENCALFVCISGFRV